MASIRVDTDRMRDCASELWRVSKDLGNAAGETSRAGLLLTFQIASRPQIVASVWRTALRLRQEQAKALALQRALEELIRLYERMEKDRAKVHVQMGRSGRDLLRTDSEQMDREIEQFEREHPEEARLLNDFLNSGSNNRLTEDDIRKIKYLLIHAEEPYRSSYLKSLNQFTIGNGDLGKGAYYRPGDKTVNYSYPDSFDSDPRGPYTTLFHECGHAIDDQSNLVNVKGSDTESFTVYNESMGRNVTLREAIEYDVFYNESNPHSVASMANQIVQSGGTGHDGDVNKVIAAFQSGNTRGLSKADQQLYNAVRNQHKRSTSGVAEQYEAVSDVYGGMSNNELRNGYGHDNSYWKDPSKAGKELWAEYFSYHMAGDQQNLAYVQEYFPEASKVLDSYADQLAR